MKKRYALNLLACSLSLILLLSGCLPKSTLQPKPSENSEASAGVTASDNNSEAPAPDDNGDKPDDASSAPADIGDEPVDCNWTMYVDQTIPITKDGLTVNYTLLLIAQKAGGKDVNGTYQGAAYVGINFDASQMSNEALSFLGGFDVNAYAYDLNLDVVSYDIEAYSDYGLKEGEAPIAPLVPYESMALISPQMEGTGTLNPSFSGIQGEQGGIDESVTSTTAMTMKITINSGKVSVYIPELNISYSFNGTLTGEPLQSGEPGDEYEQTIDKIEAIIDEKEAEASSAGGDMGDLSDILGQFGGN